MPVQMTFSLATEEDAAAIAEINESHAGTDDPGGFLVIALSREEIKGMIRDDNIHFYTAKDQDGIVLGYVEIYDEMDLRLLDDMTWDSEDARRTTLSILSGDYAYVKQLATRKGFQRQGVGTFIYQSLQKELREPIVVFAANKPKRNLPSILFHEKLGYRRVSRLYRAEFGEITDYESFFYVKAVD